MESFDIATLRAAAPYIYAHQGSTFVISLPAEVMASDALSDLIQDLALMQTLGIKLIIVYGTGVFNRHTLGVIKQTKMRQLQHTIGEQQTRLEALFSTGLVNTPMAGMKLTTVSGNFVVAKPIGILAGVDQQYRGEVRRIETTAIRQQLEINNIVLLSSLGYSPSGECFYIDEFQLAANVAASMPSEKLIFLSQEKALLDSRKQRLKFLNLNDTDKLLKRRKSLSKSMRTYLELAIQACVSQVQRTHILSCSQTGVLLQELFSHAGAGTLISDHHYDEIRPAKINDVGGIQSLIKPLEDEGILLARSTEQIERELDHYVVIERDGFVIACAALIPYQQEHCAELGSIAVHKEFQHEGHGTLLMEFLENKARKLAMQSVFVLTTRALHWFYENGYKKCPLDTIPVHRQQMHDMQRNSSVLVKSL